MTETVVLLEKRCGVIAVFAPVSRLNVPRTASPPHNDIQRPDSDFHITSLRAYTSIILQETSCRINLERRVQENLIKVWIRTLSSMVGDSAI